MLVLHHQQLYQRQRVVLTTSLADNVHVVCCKCMEVLVMLVTVHSHCRTLRRCGLLGGAAAMI